MEATTQKANRLEREKSPYLQQHARNPVEWYPWSSEAFERARREDRPVFLSIGYHACHWCHVMERESFADPEVARLMNETFVCVKVDREERPDIDAVYMAACQAMTGTGGWPLNIILTPDGKPFTAGTYIPKEGRFGRIGMLELIPAVGELWEKRRGEAVMSAERITAVLRQAGTPDVGNEPGPDALDEAFRVLSANFDEKNGGFGDAPKFPAPHQLLFLLRYWRRTGNGMALLMVERTLEAMRRGGIFDHIGFGFHRYSTDGQWRIPHFEKMLPDQALMAMAYTDAYLATGKEEYRNTAWEVFAYVLRDLRDEDGGFYSSEDADSEGEEGRFYLWTGREMDEVLGKEEAALVRDVFSVEEGGNYREEATADRTGRNILHIRRPLAGHARHLGIPESELRRRLEEARRKLFLAREARFHPFLDEKILCDWNGLMIAALARASRALDEPSYLAAARQAAEFIMICMRDSGGRLFHRYCDGEAAVPGFLDDYAGFIGGLIELYEASFDVRYLVEALALTEILKKHFLDAEDGTFFMTADDAETVLMRQKEFTDGAHPSGNSMMMMNLLRLGRLTGRAEFEAMADRIGHAAAGPAYHAPAAYTALLAAVDYATGRTSEVVIAGDSRAEETRAMVRSLGRLYSPNAVVLLRPTEVEEPDIVQVAPFTKEMAPGVGRAAAYVCSNGACGAPVTDAAKVAEALGAARPRKQRKKRRTT